MTRQEKRTLVVASVCVALLFAVAFVFRATTFPYSSRPVPVTQVGVDVTREEAERDPNAALARMSDYGSSTPGTSSAHPSSVTGEILAVDWEARTLTLEVHLMFTRPIDVMEGLSVNLGFDVDQKAEVEAALAVGGEWYVQYFNGVKPNTFSIYFLSPAKDYDTSPVTDRTE